VTILITETEQTGPNHILVYFSVLFNSIIVTSQRNIGTKFIVTQGKKQINPAKIREVKRTQLIKIVEIS